MPSGGRYSKSGEYQVATIGSAELDNNSVTNAKLADVPTATFKGRTTGGTGDPEDLTTAQATALLDLFTSVLKGLAPASGGGTTNFLRADGSWVAPPGGGGDNISVNGAAAIDADFDDATPAAPAGGVNVKWQKDTAAPDNISAHLAANDVGDTVLRDSSALSVIGRSANSSGDPADIAAVAASGAVLRESGSTLSFGTVATAGIADNAITNPKLRDSGALSVIGRSVNSSGDPADIAAVAASGAVLRESGSALGFGTVATAGIADDAVTYAKIQNVSASPRFLGRITGGAGDTEELTGTQATTLLDIFTSVLKGLAPASGGGTVNFLRADGTWAAPGGGPGGGISLGLATATMLGMNLN